MRFSRGLIPRRREPTRSMDTVRLDKWLWAARFFKTRSMASKAIQGGKVHLNEQRIKPSRQVVVGDLLEITRNETTFVVEVLAISALRRPAVEARLLYAETEASIKRREEQRELRKLLRDSAAGPPKRPDKRDRRKIREFTRKR